MQASFPGFLSMGHRRLLTGAAALHFVVSSVVVVNGHLGVCWHFCVLYK